MKASTRDSYAKRIERVVDYLTTNIERELDLDRLATVACLSPYHFHRIYRSMVGETVTDTVRRMRLHRAALNLQTTQVPLARLARRAGYGSVQAFHRAFRETYGVAPSVYRAEFSVRLASSTDSRTSYPLKILTRERQRVAVLRHVGDYLAIGKTFERLAIWASQRGLLGSNVPARRLFGIFYDDPAAKPVAELISDACISIPDDFIPDGEVSVIEIPATRCAVLLHVGPYAELERAYQWLFGSWLANSDNEPADLPCVEEYLNSPRNVPAAQLRTEIHAPLCDES
jgi:AraC family transcriptional regulator